MTIELKELDPDQPPFKPGPDPEHGQWHIGFGVQNGNVIIDFGAPIDHILLTPTQALTLAGKIAHISGVAAGVTQTPEPPPAPDIDHELIH